MKLFAKDAYEKKFAERAKTVQDYQLQILHAEQKIKELQNACSHDEHLAVMYSFRVGSYQPSHICKSCAKYLGNATEDESSELWAAFRGER